MRFRTLLALMLAAAVAGAAGVAAASPPPERGERDRPAAEAKEDAREHAERAKELARERVAGAKERAKARAKERAKARAQERAKERAERLRAKKQKKQQRRALRCGQVLALGNVLEADGDSLVVDVLRSNLARLRGHEVSFLLKEKTGFKGAEGPDDLAEGDRVLIHGSACKAGEKVQFLAGRVEVKEQAARASDEEAEEDEAVEEEPEDEEPEAEEEEVSEQDTESSGP